MKKLIPGILSMLLCLGMATGCDSVQLPDFMNGILGKDTASSESIETESTPDSSTPDDSSSEETPVLGAHEKDLKDVKEYIQGIVNQIALETRKDFTLINTYSFFGETAKYDIAWSVNIDGVTIVEGENEDTVKIGELEEDTPYVLTATITDPEGCHSIIAEFDAIALKAEQVVPEKITAAPAENTAYKLHMYQVSKAQDLYFTGVMSGFYLATTNASKGETYEDGIDVYAEKVEGKDAYYLTFTNPNGEKQYIGVTNTYNNGSYHDNVILAGSTEVAAEGDPTTFEFTWSDEYKTMVATLSGVKSGGTQDTTETKTTTYFLGTSGSYYTFGACPVEEAAESYVGCLVQMVNKADVSAEDKIATEKDALNITTAFSGDVSEELPTKGSTYSDVSITWAVKSGDATIENNVLTVAAPTADTTIVLTATFTCGTASVTKDVEINVFPKSVVTEVTNPEENTAYAFYLYQANKAKNYYFTGKMDGNFLGTTDDPAKAADVYAEKSGNGIMIYVLDENGAKSYIKLTEYKKNETDKYYKASISLAAEGSVFTLNTQFGMWVCNTGNDVFYLGTYNDFTTISSSAASYVKVDNAGVTQFIAKFGIIDESALPPEGGEGGDDTHEHNFVDGKCECGEEDPNYVAPDKDVVKATGDSFTIESYATANGWANSTLYATIEHEFYTITTSGTPNGDWGLNTGKYYTNGQNWRIYQNESPAVTFTAVEGKTIATIKVTYALKNGGILTFNGANYESDALITVNAATATFSVGQTGTATNGQVQITAIEVLFATEGGEIDPPAHEHSYDEGVVTTEPTCTVAGVKTFTCSECGETKTEAIPTTAHNYVDGVCSVCGDVTTTIQHITAAPVESVIYTYHVWQSNLKKDQYFVGEMDGYYFKTTEDATAAVELQVEYIDDTTFNVFFMNASGAKQYLGVTVSADGKHDNIVYTNEPTSSFFWNEELKTICTHLDSNKDGVAADYYFGNYSNYKTISASTIDKAATSNVGGLVFVKEVEEGGEIDPPAHEHNFVEGKCECGETDPNYVPPHEHNFVEGKCECGAEDPNYVAPEAPVVGGGSADFGTIVLPSNKLTGDSSYTATYTTANGWVTEYSAIQCGGTKDMNPQFVVIGSDTTSKAPCLNGKVGASGKVTSPTLKGGISKLSITYTKMFTDTQLGFKVTITDLTTGTVYTDTELVTLEKNEKYVKYSYEFVLETAITGDFTIVIENTNPSQNTSGNKDRLTLLDVSWTAPAEGGEVTPPVEETKYTLTMVNGENPRVPGAVTTAEYVAGATLELPVLEAEGKTFKGWYLVDLATGQPSEEAPATMPAAALTLKAVWEYDIYTLTIVNGETSTEFKFAVEYNGDIMIKVTDLAYVLAKNLPEGYIWLEEVPATFELKNYTFTAHTHAYSETTTTEPTCTEKGLKTFTCSCGDRYTEEIPATEHNYNSEVTVAPTLNSVGTETYTCTNCNDSYTNEIPMLEGAVANVNGYKYATFAEALAAAKAGDVVTLMADLTASEIIVLDKAITLDGAEYTLTSTATRAINVDCTGDVAIKNLTIVAEKGCERGINIINQASNVVLDGLKVSFVATEGPLYGAHIAFSATGANLTVKNSEISAYGAVAVYGNNHNVIIEDSTLVGTNVYSTETNAFMTIALGGDNINVTVNGGVVKAVAQGTMNQFIVGSQTDATTNSTVTINAELVFEGEKAAYIYLDGFDTNVVKFPVAYVDALVAEGFCVEADDTYAVVKAHNYEEVTTAPTCTAAGYTTYTCANCGDSYKENGEAAKGHADNDGDYKCDDCSKIVEPEADSVLTLAQAIALSNLYAHNTYTTNKYYIVATIVDIYNTQYGNANVIDAEGNKFVVYGMYSYDGKIRYDALEAKPVAGDEVTVYGVLGKYNTTLQMKNGWIDDFIAHEHDYSEVVTAPTCTADGYTTVTCSICKVSSVKDEVKALGHTTEAGTCERCGQEIGGESNEPAVVATFDFGANGNAAHVDGNDLGTSKSYTVGTYTLALKSLSKVFGPAYDAKGNSCLKFGTSKVVGSMSFTVPENVTKVVIYVAGYKAATSTNLTINSTSYNVKTTSNNGAYTAIEVDTTTTKTITFKTVTYRCMVNTIEFWGL